VAPFLGRPGYAPLPRPHDPKRAAPWPRPPTALVGFAGVPGVAAEGMLARVAQRLGISLAEVDATMTVRDVLDEVDLQAYLADVDHEPAAAPTK
jgi:hypothetical protein